MALMPGLTSDLSVVIERVMIRAPPARVTARPSARCTLFLAAEVQRVHTRRICPFFWRTCALTSVWSGRSKSAGVQPR